MKDLLVMIAAVCFGVFVWLLWEIGSRILAALDQLPWLFPTVLIVSCVAFLATVVGAAVNAVLSMSLKSKQVLHHDGLFPVMHDQVGGRPQYYNPNPERAQIMAAMVANGGPTLRSSAIRSALEAQPQPWKEAPVPEQQLVLPPVSLFPQRVEVYSAPLPREIAVPVGVDAAGQQVALPLRGMGNVVVGGLPNYGKSELLGSMAAGLLRQDPRGERAQLAVIDMKLVSFGNMPSLAALRWPVATSIDDAHEIIAAVRAECDQRFEAMRDARARTLEEYAQLTGERLPYVTVLLDEIADLTCDDDRGRRERFLASAMDVARKGRAAGVGLVMATQRPSVDVLPSSLRNLAGAAIAFRVSRNHDSVAVLGEPGAEVLPVVPGRCLVKRGEIIETQAYACGLEGGRFDAFLASLPRVDQIAAPAWPVRSTDVPVYRPDSGDSAGIPVPVPVFRTDETGPYTPDQIAYLRQRYVALGSLKAVQREIYGQEGGHWFYEIRNAVCA